MFPSMTKSNQSPVETLRISRPGLSPSCKSARSQDVRGSVGVRSSCTAYLSVSSVPVIVRIVRTNLRRPAGPYKSTKGYRASVRLEGRGVARGHTAFVRGG